MKKVIRGLEICSELGSWHGRDCEFNGAYKDCPYRGCETGCVVTIAKDAIALLKEQEAKQAIKQTYHVMMNQDYENPVEVTRYDWLCPTCKSLLCRDIDVIDDNYHFCKVCGQAVKWDG